MAGLDPVDDALLQDLQSAKSEPERDAVTAKLMNRHPQTAAAVDNLDPKLITGTPPAPSK